MTFNQNFADILFPALREITENGRFADRVIESVLKTYKRWSDEERSFFAETTYEIVRNWRLLWAMLGRETPVYDERTLWKLLAAYLVLKGQKLSRRPEFKEVNLETMHRKLDAAMEKRSVRESIPEWLDEVAESELGSQRWEPVLHALNEQPHVILRANLLKTTKEKLQKELLKEEIRTVPVKLASEALVLPERANVFRTQAFKNGLFEVQDAGSQTIAPFLKVEPGMRVVDACAGSGGKTLHLAALMQNKGRIIAMDTFERKLEDLRKRASRAGADIIETRAITSTKVIKRLSGQADRLLLDVPCSGLGVLKRNPDTKLKLQPDDIDKVRKIQSEILASYPNMVKPGGLMVYATCSVLPSEDEEQVRNFLKNNSSNWELLEEKRLWPDTDGFDGFYMALLKRKG
jgi:16S rRNA (cytosine967-C5)-methyltransferase